MGGHEKEADARGAHLQRAGRPAGEGRSYKISGRGARVAVGVSGLGRFGVGNGDLDKDGKKTKKGC